MTKFKIRPTTTPYTADFMTPDERKVFEYFKNNGDPLRVREPGDFVRALTFIDHWVCGCGHDLADHILGEHPRVLDVFGIQRTGWELSRGRTLAPDKEPSVWSCQ